MVMGGALKTRTSAVVFGMVLLGNLFTYSIATTTEEDNPFHFPVGGDLFACPITNATEEDTVFNLTMQDNGTCWSIPPSFLRLISIPYWRRLLNDDTGESVGPEVALAELNFGVETVGGVMAKVIPGTAIIPTKKSKVFTTTRDQQTSVTIQVFEGASRYTKNCLFLGEFNLTGIPPAPRGTPQIKVTFLIGSYYTLTVKAEEEAYGISKKIIIPDEDHFVCFRDVKEMRREAEEEEKRIVGPHSLQTYVYNHINDKDRPKVEAETSMSDKKFVMCSLEKGRRRFKTKASTSENQIAEMDNTM